MIAITEVKPVFVTHFGKSDRNVVSVLAGYKYQKQSDVTFGH